jgi:hypothetical protein
MATGTLLPSGYETLEDANGATVPGGLIWTYQAGTVTPQATYTDATLTVANSNPIIADGAGRWTAYAAAGVGYKLVFETPAIPPAHGATIKTVDNLSGPVFSGQLAFPPVQVPSSDPNTLDDYEEGVWTPVIGGSGGQSGQAYLQQVGQYVKVGRAVTVSFDVTLSNKGTITGNVQINGLPFATVMNSGGVVGYFAGLAVAKNSLTLLGQGSSLLVGGAAAAVTTVPFLVTADIGNNTQIVGSITYITSQ